MSGDAYPRLTRTQSLLLGLPRELRDMICTRLLYEPQSPPSSPENAGPRFEEFNDHKGILRMHLADERFPGHTHLNLLLCCRKINGEFSQLLALQFPLLQCLDFILDCMVFGEALWPTWNIYPGLNTAKFCTLRIDLRIWPIMILSAEECSSYLHQVISYLMNRFLHCGPRLTAIPPNPESTHHDVHIDTLCINIMVEGSTDLFVYHIFKMSLDQMFENTLSIRVDGLKLMDNFHGNISKLRLCYQHYVVEHEFEEKQNV